MSSSPTNVPTVEAFVFTPISGAQSMPFNEIFDDPKGDLAVVSSDRFQARVLRGRLRFASEVFFDLLERHDGQVQTVEGLPMVKLSESANDVGMLLKFALHPRPSDCESLGFERLKRLLDLTDKYATPQAATVATLLLGRHLPTEAPTVFALAVLNDLPSLARKALADFGPRPQPQQLSLDSPAKPSARPRSLTEVPAYLFDRLPASAIRSFLALQEKVLHPESGKVCAWTNVADEFTMDSVQQRSKDIVPVNHRIMSFVLAQPPHPIGVTVDLIAESVPGYDHGTVRTGVSQLVDVGHLAWGDSVVRTHVVLPF